MVKNTPKVPTFDEYYRVFYQDRWESLKSALLEERKPVAYTEGLLKPYYLDEASIAAARALGVSEGDRVLDLCAAPGGKTLVLATALKGSGSLTANDRSSARRARLRDVINDHLAEQDRANITITGHDAARWSLYEQDAYDRILLDAPCSSERHVLSDEKALKDWSPSRPKRLAVNQFAMLASALESVVPGGLILYSTCSINPLENEEVIAKLEKRRAGRFEELHLDRGEKRSFGSIILPDVSDGKGPLYMCLIRRLT
ncbi:MAG TPA: RsmB/NOP family class I SAM-dependent RNA methyltransferase [Sphaerochaeta sp.]|nr:RsmB/NOP family class I SAM-dependent RNA methyltransferase [Sphaerochaeta sp.]HPY45743.1 RsmB/NOP family class I SAM-dependent RNA methyltransferase [Sphaerochaeta sp.]HQB05605.1 RsmB/NOP family class I SAM-dependent RNA methyltransferase [Sphaerochaeta sp.]